MLTWDIQNEQSSFVEWIWNLLNGYVSDKHVLESLHSFLKGKRTLQIRFRCKISFCVLSNYNVYKWLLIHHSATHKQRNILCFFNRFTCCHFYNTNLHKWHFTQFINTGECTFRLVRHYHTWLLVRSKECTRNFLEYVLQTCVISHLNWFAFITYFSLD